jgi:collagen type VI alpha
LEVCISPLHFFIIGTGECQDTDVVFVLDSSATVTEEEFKMTKQFVKAIIGNGGYSSSKDRLALVRFSSKTYINWHAGFDWFDDKKELHQAIDDLSHVPGKRDSGAALEIVRTRVFTRLGGMREKSKKIAVIITNGDSTDQTNLEKEAIVLKNMHVTIYVIGVGKGVSRAKLKRVVSAPAKRHIFTVERYRNLSKIMQPFQEATCIGVGKS